MNIPTFGLMVACAMLCAYFILRADVTRRGLAPENPAAVAELFIAVPCLAGIAGAKLYHALQSPIDLIAHPFSSLFSAYGFAWFGGLIAGFIAWVMLAMGEEIPLLDMMDAGSAAAAFGYGIGRIGCLLSGDGDYGTPTSLPWGMSFPHGLVPTTQRVHPTPIYELIAACFIAWILWRLGARQIASRPAVSFKLKKATASAKRKSGGAPSRGTSRKSGGVAVAAEAQVKEAAPGARLQTSARASLPLPAGSIFAIYLLLTGLERFLIEFIRINPRSFLGMSNAQAASVLSMIGGVGLWLWLRSRRQSAA